MHPASKNDLQANPDLLINFRLKEPFSTQLLGRSKANKTKSIHAEARNIVIAALTGSSSPDEMFMHICDLSLEIQELKAEIIMLKDVVNMALMFILCSSGLEDNAALEVLRDIYNTHITQFSQNNGSRNHEDNSQTPVRG